MTLRDAEGKVGVCANVFVATPNQLQYVFCGATVTITNYKYQPNSVSLKGYFAFDSTKGLGIKSTGIALLVNGEEVAFVDMESFPHWDSVADMVIAPALFYLSSEALWTEIQSYLKTIAPHNSSARQILAEMEEWTSVSMDTLRQIKSNEATKPERMPDERAIEVHVAGRQWLWYNQSSGLLGMGYGNEIWGKKPSRQFNRGALLNASPAPNGWFVILSPDNRYFLRMMVHGAEILSFWFPYGNWQRQDGWTYWYPDRGVLTPDLEMVIVKANNRVLATNQDWIALGQWLSPMTTENVQLVHRSGEKYMPDVSQYGENWNLYLGNESALITHQKQDCIWFSVAELKKPLLQPRWQVAAFPSHVTHTVYVVRGNPDVYIVAFLRQSVPEWCIGIVDSQGNVGLAPLFIDTGKPSDWATLEDNRVVIRLPGSQSKAGDRLATIDVLDRQIRTCVNGITLSERLTKFSGQGGAMLYDYLERLANVHPRTVLPALP